EDRAELSYLPGGMTPQIAIKHFIKAVNKGLLKTFSKMGISTLQSYRGAQVFEAIGLNQDLVHAYFAGTTSRIGGVGLDVLAREAMLKYEFSFLRITEAVIDLEVVGSYGLHLSVVY